METPLTVHPDALPPGSLVGPWRLLALGAHGSYGVVFRAELASQPEAGPFALKLARQPGDPRFALEVELLSRLRHPNVPRLHGSGEWTGPGGALFPFLVMDWVDGLPLYSWARLQPLSSRQVLRLLAPVARALQATHAAGGLHRDVKGDNILVRSCDGHVLLTDFGSCTWRGAPVLTRQSHPPGTAHYWSPQAQLHHWKFRRHPSARYSASPEDDVYALGVTAYRLVTGRYPLAANEEEASEDYGFSRFPALVPAQDLVQLSPELARWIGQMLSEQPSARGTAAELALGLELAANKAGPEANRPIGPRMAPAPETREAPPVPARPPVTRHMWLTAAAVSAVVAAGLGSLLHFLRVESPTADTGAVARASQVAPQAGETTSLAELSLTEPLSAPEPLPENEGLTEDLPKEPLTDQRLPPCNKPLIKINGGCWILVGEEAPPCVVSTYEWKKQCYLPYFGPSRPATSEQKEKPRHGLGDP